MQSTPTLEEFTNAVRKDFSALKRRLSQAEVDEYIYGDEAQEEIRNRYAIEKEEYESGKITYRVFMEGCVASVVHCLNLMY